MTELADERVLSSRSPMRKPGRLLWQMYSDTVNALPLCMALFRREFAVRYRRSYLGILWAFVTPAVITATWVLLKHKKVLSIADTNISYIAHVLMGVIMWRLFQSAFTAPRGAISANMALLTRQSAPIEALLISRFLLLLVDAGVALLILAVAFLAFGWPVASSWPLGIMAFAMLLLLGFSLGLVLLPWQIIYNDVQQLLNLVTAWWFFATPVIWPLGEGLTSRLVVTFNPPAAVLDGARALVTGADLVYPVHFWGWTVASVVMLVAGILLNRLGIRVIAL